MKGQFLGEKMEKRGAKKDGVGAGDREKRE